MLQELRIKNFALIDEATLEFDPKCNILTGETGAGKTVIVEAMNLLLGDRADTTLIRSGAPEASVEGLFFMSDQQQRLIASVLGDDLEFKGELIIGRVISTEGKSRCYLNGRLVNLGLLGEMGRLLVDIHGQHEHQSLLNVSSHLDYLDRYAGRSLLSLKSTYQVIFKKWLDIKETLDKLKQNIEETNDQAELLRFQIDEIERAKLSAEEEESLLAEREIVRHAERLFEAAGFAYQSLGGHEEESDGALDKQRTALSELERVAGVDRRLDQIIESLRNVLFEAEDLVLSLREYREEVEFSPQRLEEIESRLSLIGDLKKKYGQTIEEIVAYQSKARKQMEKMDSSPEKIGQLELEKEEIETELADKAGQLSAERTAAARKFEDDVRTQLAELNMPKAQFKVALKQEEADDGLLVDGGRFKLTADGMDQIEFMISPNVGEPVKPLSKIASGGEISRVMLALKIIFGEADTIPTLIFDEVDVGIGGKTAAAVGQKLALLSQNHQVICITHLPQIASCADCHFFVSKTEEAGRTLTRVTGLDYEGRINEIARMISGAEVSEASRKHAQELIDHALKVALDGSVKA